MEWWRDNRKWTSGNRQVLLKKTTAFDERKRTYHTDTQDEPFSTKSKGVVTQMKLSMSTF